MSNKANGFSWYIVKEDECVLGEIFLGAFLLSSLLAMEMLFIVPFESFGTNNAREFKLM